MHGMIVDTSGDGVADSVLLDTDGDGRPDTIVPAAGTAGMLVDTSGDGLADSVHVDTSGDGRPDTFVPLRQSYATAASVVRAVDLARKASKREKTPVDDAAEEWSAHAWVDSMTHLKHVLGDALLQPLLREVPNPSGAMQFEYLKSLADASVDDIENLLKSGSMLRRLAEAIVTARMSYRH